MEKVTFVDLLQKLLLSSEIDSSFVNNLKKLRQVVVCKSCNRLPITSDGLLVEQGVSSRFLCKNCAKEDGEEKYKKDLTFSCFLSTYKSFCEFLMRSDDIPADDQIFEIVQESLKQDSNESEEEEEEEIVEYTVSNESTNVSTWIKNEEQDDNRTTPITINDSEYILMSDTSDEKDRNNYYYPQLIHNDIKTWSENNVDNVISNSSTIQVSSHDLRDIVSSPSNSSNASNDSGLYVSPRKHNFLIGTVVSLDEASKNSTKKGPIKKLKVRLPKKGCRCGSTSQNPGKLTCLGQRCQCYIDRNACEKNLCRCKGCRNPVKKTVDGNTVIDAKTKIVTVLPPTMTLNSPTNLFGASARSTFASVYPVGKFSEFSMPIISVSSTLQPKLTSQ